MRVYGLSGSGLDVDSLVKDLMKAANTPLNKLNQQKATLQWKKEDYSSIYNTVSDFRARKRILVAKSFTDNVIDVKFLSL